MALTTVKGSVLYDIPEYNHSPLFTFQNATLDATIVDIVPEGGAYNAFPKAHMIKGDRLLVVYWHGNGHSPSIAGDNLGDLRAIYSDDYGLTWSSPQAILGNISGGGSGTEFAYYRAFGVTKDGRAVVVGTKYNGSYNESGIMFSDDGVSWTPWTSVTFSGEGTIPAAPLPFGTIKTLPSGKLAVPFYSSGNGRWLGMIDTSISETAVTMDLVVDSTFGGGGNEFASVIVSETERYTFHRISSTSQIPIYRTVDGGVTWSAYGNCGVTASSYLVQDAHLVTVKGELYIALFVGLRSSSLDSDVVLFMAPLRQARESGAFTFTEVFRTTIAVADGGVSNRDAYVGAAYDRLSSSFFVATHDETNSGDDAKIQGFCIRLSDYYSTIENTGPITNVVPRFNSVTYTDNGSTSSFTKIGNQVFGRLVMDYTGLDTADGSGISLIVSDFPYSVSSNGPGSVDVENSTGINFTSGDDVSVQFGASDAILQLQKVDGVGWGYNSGKINASGIIIFHVQYTTTD